MYAVSPINTIRFGFSDRQYQLGGIREEEGPGTRILRRVASLIKEVTPYTFQETNPARQTVIHHPNHPVVFYYLTPQGQPGKYQLNIQA